MISLSKMKVQLEPEEAEQVAVEVLEYSLSLIDYFIEDSVTHGYRGEDALKELENTIKYKSAIETTLKYLRNEDDY